MGPSLTTSWCAFVAAKPKARCASSASPFAADRKSAYFYDLFLDERNRFAGKNLPAHVSIVVERERLRVGRPVAIGLDDDRAFVFAHHFVLCRLLGVGGAHRDVFAGKLELGVERK